MPAPVDQSSSVSVVITTYNYARYLGPALESVLGQTLPPAEVVVIDDGSTDSTPEIVEPYLSRGVRYIRQDNLGAGAARNRGIQETRCDLVAFLDADDRWLPEKLALQVDHLRRFPQVGLVTCGYWYVHESGRSPEKVLIERLDSQWVYPRLLVENTIGNPSMVVVRRVCFEEVGLFDEELPLGQDWEMWIRLARRFPVGALSEPLMLFTVHEGSLTSGQSERRRKWNQLIVNRHTAQVKSPVRRAMLRRGAAGMTDYYDAAANVTRPGRRIASLRLALRALWLDPFYRWQPKLLLLLHAAIGPAVFHQASSSVRAIRRARKR